MIISILIISSCGVREDTQLPGVPVIRCKNSPILPSGGGNYKIEPLIAAQENVAYSCNFGVPQSGWDDYVRGKSNWYEFEVETMKMKIVKVPDAAGGAAAGGGKGGGGGETTAAAGQGTPLPLAGIKINVNSTGLVFDEDKTHPDVKKLWTGQKKYGRGIATGPQLWCSDTTGVITVDYYIRCPPPGGTYDGSILISSGATAAAFKIKVTTDAFEEEPEPDPASATDNNPSTSLLLSPWRGYGMNMNKRAVLKSALSFFRLGMVASMSPPIHLIDDRSRTTK